MGGERVALTTRGRYNPRKATNLALQKRGCSILGWGGDLRTSLVPCYQPSDANCSYPPIIPTLRDRRRCLQTSLVYNMAATWQSPTFLPSPPGAGAQYGGICLFTTAAPHLVVSGHTARTYISIYTGIRPINMRRVQKNTMLRGL